MEKEMMKLLKSLSREDKEKLYNYALDEQMESLYKTLPDDKREILLQAAKAVSPEGVA